MRPCLVDRPYGTGDTLIMFFYQDTVIETEDGKKTYPADTLMFWKSGAGHYYGCRDMRWLHSWVHCDGSAIWKLISKLSLPRNNVVPKVNPVVVEKYLLDLHNELNCGAPDRKIVINIFENFFRELKRIIDPVQVDRKIPGGVLNARMDMEMNFIRPFTLKELAKSANLSVPHFCAEFKRSFGISPVEYLIQVRMKHAAILLRDINRRVSEIGGQVGYSDLFYFSRLFKKRFGVSPLEFRRRIGR